MPLTTSDKITLTKYPPLPSKCASCFRGSDGTLEFVDFQISFDYEGAVVICTECWATAAELIKYVSVDEIAPLMMEIDHLRGELEKVSNERDSVQHAMDSLLAVRPNLVSNDHTSDDSASEATEKDDRQPELPIGESGVNDPKPSEPPAKRRSENISQPSIRL